VKTAVGNSRRIASCGLIAVVLSLVAACAGHPPPAATRPVSASPAATKKQEHKRSSARPVTAAGTLGRYRVGQRRLTFVEPAQAGPRTLDTVVWYPLAGSRPAAGPLPVIMFAPGFMQCSAPYSSLLRSWASAGYVVAAVDFPRTSCLVADPYEADLVNQPRDVSYALSRLLDLSAQPDDPFHGVLDRREIGAAGQSDGGDTVAALAANGCCTDHRLTAVAVLSGAEWPPMPGRYFAHGAPPMLFVQGAQGNPAEGLDQACRGGVRLAVLGDRRQVAA
jgi:dienelactone hydrolase